MSYTASSHIREAPLASGGCTASCGLPVMPCYMSSGRAASLQQRRHVSAPRTTKVVARRHVRGIAARASGEQVLDGLLRPSATAERPAAQDVVMGFISALNARDWGALGQVLADDCVLQNMSCDRPALGRLAVGRFYADLLSEAGISDATRIIIEDMTQGDPSRVGLTWHIELEGVELPVTKGISFYSTNQQGLICSIRENPEHFLKLGHLAAGGLGLAAPIVRTLGPAALPAFWFSMMANHGSSTEPSLAPAPAGKWFMSPDHLNSPLASLAAPDYRLQLQRQRQLAAAAADGAGGQSRGPAALPELVQGLFASAVAALPFGAAGGDSGSSGRSSGVSSALRSSDGSLSSGSGYGGSGSSGDSSRSRRSVQARFQSSSGDFPAASAMEHGPNTSSKGASSSSSSSVSTGSSTDGRLASASSAREVKQRSEDASMTAAAAEDGSTASVAVSSTAALALNTAAAAAAAAAAGRPANSDAAAEANHAVAAAAAAGAAAQNMGAGDSAATGGPASAPSASTAPASTLPAAKSEGCSLPEAANAAAAAAASANAGVSAQQVVSAEGRVPPAQGSGAPINLHGLWRKDLEASEVDEYEKALDLWHINGIQKATARLIEGMDIVHDGNTFQVHFLTIIPQNLFKVTEKFKIGGTTNIMRRDLRRGQCKSTASNLPNGVLVKLQWEDPYAGGLEEQYVCPGGDASVLHVVSTISIGGTSITTTQVFRRHRGTKEALLQESEQRNGTAKDVLGRFGMRMPGFGMKWPGS